MTHSGDSVRGSLVLHHADHPHVERRGGTSSPSVVRPSGEHFTSSSSVGREKTVLPFPVVRSGSTPSDGETSVSVDVRVLRLGDVLLEVFKPCRGASAGPGDVHAFHFPFVLEAQTAIS